MKIYHVSDEIKLNFENVYTLLLICMSNGSGRRIYFIKQKLEK